MFGRRRRPVLRIDRITGAEQKWAGKRPIGDASADRVGPARYAFSVAPQTQHQLSRWADLGRVLKSIGGTTERTAVRLSRSVEGREIAAEVLGAAALDRVFVRWSDTGLRSKASPPWYVTRSDRMGSMTRVPLGEVPTNFDEIAPEEYGRFPGLDIAAVPSEAVLTTAEAEVAVRWFLTSWPDDASPVLDWL